MKQISSMISSSRSTVLKYLKECGIPIRSSGENITRKRGLGYGRKSSGRSHKLEQENTRKIHDLRDQGYSSWKIAEALGSMKIPTKTRRGKWHAKTVQEILKVSE